MDTSTPAECTLQPPEIPLSEIPPSPPPESASSSINSPLSSPTPEMLDRLDHDDLDIDQTEKTIEETVEETAEETTDYPEFRTRAKLQYMVNALEHISWSTESFLRAWINSPVQLRHKKYHSREKRQEYFLGTIDRLKLKRQLYDPAILMEELTRLVKKQYFDQFDLHATIEDIDFNQATKTIKKTAPRWYRFIWNCLVNSRFSKSSYQSATNVDYVTAKYCKVLFFITCVVCHSKSSKHIQFYGVNTQCLSPGLGGETTGG
ncbi:hypothetical protein BDV37DRAFT_238884 [Aspergillus pseudonomiae]|uniref:Uncharacterized protein n=1 Tax=Aspergillus pseudonomiae TaxID=1506151 RepID=A0A5N7DQ34_9EURO|nr:uncharacterized protein BDV37DRAFT_238884 [Aspergillus pseudonomiae]KAE8408139.1 hypothetical protein BDV37DRAFT_238884 [Aspergillus pseudonomiae]